MPNSIKKLEEAFKEGKYDQLLKDIEPLKKNQYGQYLMDVMAGKFLDK